jgi:SAM-dependent methyltransferase
VLAQVQAAAARNEPVGREAYRGFYELLAREAFDQCEVEARDLMNALPEIEAKLRVGCKTAEFGCGSGALLRTLARMFPKGRFYGFDILEEFFCLGEGSPPNTTFRQTDTARFDYVETFDIAIAVNAIHDHTDRAASLRAIRRSLRPLGVFVMLETAASDDIVQNIEAERAATRYAISCLHCVPVALNLHGDTPGMMWAPSAVRTELTNAGFLRPMMRTIPGDPPRNIFVSEV